MALPSLKMPSIVANFFKGREFTYEAPRVGETSPIYPLSLNESLRKQNILDNNWAETVFGAESSRGTNYNKNVAYYGKFGRDVGIEQSTINDYIKKAKEGDKRYLNLLPKINTDTLENAKKSAIEIANFKNTLWDKNANPIGTKYTDPVDIYTELYNASTSKDAAKKNFLYWWEKIKQSLSIPEVQAAELPSMKMPGAESMNFEVGAGFTPEQAAWYASRGLPSPRENVTKQTIPVGTEIKLPFMQKAMTVPSGVLGDLTKGLVEYPERLAVSGKEFLTDTIAGRVTEPDKQKLYSVPSIQQTMSDVFTAYAAGEAPWWIVPLEITGAFMDLSVAGGFLRGGVRALAKQATEAEVKNAWDFLGRPKTTTDMNNTVRELQKIYHPDMPTGDAAKSSAINNAYNILKEKGLPTGGVLEKLGEQAMKLERPVSDLFKTEYGQTGYVGTRGLLTEQAGTQPTQPFQPIRQPAFGLSLREVPEKPIRVERYATKETTNTDKFRGGTWYLTPKSKTYIGEFKGADKGVGGTELIKTELSINNPLIVKNAIIEDGSFSVINSGYENYLPTKERRLGNELYEKVHEDIVSNAEFKKIVKDILTQNGNTPQEISAVLSSKNQFDAAMDLVISNGLKKVGYDALILENEYKGKVIDRHIFKVATKPLAQEAIPKGWPKTLADITGNEMDAGFKLGPKLGESGEIKIYRVGELEGKGEFVTTDKNYAKRNYGEFGEIKEMIVEKNELYSLPGTPKEFIYVSALPKEQDVLSDIFKKELSTIKQETRLGLTDAIKKLGGIKVSGGIKEEIMESVPTHLLNKNGQSLDEMAQELHSQGFTNIVDGDSLRTELEKMYAQKVEPIIGKDPVTKTPEFQAIPDDMKARITTFFRPSRKLESRAFSLLGNKDTTIPLLRNTFNEWVKQGVDTIIEPYAGAFTVGTHGLNNAIKSGLKNFYSNVFDKEKYLIVKAVQDGRMAEVKSAVDDAVKRFSDKVYEYSAGDTKVRKVLDDFFKESPGATIGSREFYSYIRKQPIGSQVTVYEDDFKAWSSIFNRVYKDLFVKDPEGLRDAAMTSFLKRIEQRQGEIITHNGFTSYYNKIYGDIGMVAGLEDMMKTFQLAKEYGTNIHLYGKDGAEFIKTINAKSLGIKPDKVGYYFDPPYVKSASVYDNAQELDNFSSGYQLATSHENALLEAKQGAKILLTNDVEAEYIAEMEKRLENPGLFAYREGTTPTSLITDANTKPIITQYLSTAEKTAGEREEVALVKAMQIEKNLSTATFARIRKNLGIENLKKATDEKLAQFLTFLEKLQPGDKLLTDLQIESAKDLIKEGDFVDPINLITQRDFIQKFGEQIEIMGRFPDSKIINELFPTVDIKEGHSMITRTVDKADEVLVRADKNQEGRDERFDKMITSAEKSKKDLPLLERLKRGVTPQNKEIFQALSGYPVKLTQEEVAVVAYLKNFFKKVREDLQLEKYRKHYVTHLEKPLMEKLTTNGIAKTVGEIFKLDRRLDIPVDIMLELDNIIGSEKFFKFALERKGGLDPTTNLRKIVHDYGNLYETKMALDQILPEGQMITQLLLQPRSAIWMKRYLQNLKGRGLDTNFRHGKMGWLAKIADGIVDIGYIKLLGLAYISPLKNLVAGEANSFIYQDLKNFLIGKQRFISHPVKAIKMAKEYGILEGTFAEYAEKGIWKFKKAQRIAMIGQQAGEYEIRSSLFVGELTKEEWTSGVISTERVRVMKDDIAITQGVFSKVDSPLWIQTWYGRMFMQMNRWRITNAMMIRRLAIGTAKDIKSGIKFGDNAQKLSKAFILYGIGMYLAWELGKQGSKEAAKVAQSMGEAINSIIELVTLKPIVDALTRNPTLSDLKEFAHTIQDLASYIGVPGVQKPSDWQYQGGLEDTYIAAVKTFKDLFGIKQTKQKGGGRPPAGMPSMQLPSMQLPSMKMPSMKF